MDGGKARHSRERSRAKFTEFLIIGLQPHVLRKGGVSHRQRDSAFELQSKTKVDPSQQNCTLDRCLHMLSRRFK